jgi:hypothetical protein
MQKSDSIKELASALAKAQGQMKGAVKDAANPFFKTKYADLSSVVEAIREPFSKNGLAYIQLTVPTEKDEVSVETILTHESGEWVSSILTLPVAKHDAQGYGSALTYARRYGLSAVAGVAPEDDDGNAATTAAPAKPIGKITPAGGVWESLTADQHTMLQDIIDGVRNEYNQKGANAAAKLWSEETEKISADEKVAAWNKFPSDERTAMKKAAEAAKGERKAA